MASAPAFQFGVLPRRSLASDLTGTGAAGIQELAETVSNLVVALVDLVLKMILLLFEDIKLALQGIDASGIRARGS